MQQLPNSCLRRRLWADGAADWNLFDRDEWAVTWKPEHKQTLWARIVQFGWKPPFRNIGDEDNLVDNVSVSGASLSCQHILEIWESHFSTKHKRMDFLRPTHKEENDRWHWCSVSLVQSATATQYAISPWDHHLNHIDKQCFTDRKEKPQQSTSDGPHSIKSVMCVWAVCVLCDGSFPQSESAPLPAFERTLHSSAAQQNHKTLPWQQINKILPNIYVYKKS